MWNDLQFAFRTLRRAPGFTAVAILSLALGIGANTAIFSLLYQVLLQPLPVKDPQSLVNLHDTGDNVGWVRHDSGSSIFSYPMYKALRDRSQVFDGLIGRALFGSNFSYRGNAVSATANVVTGNYFDALGIRPAAGRLLLPSDDTPSAQQIAVVLGHSFWSKHMGQDRSIVNQRVLINNHPMLVVGIAPSHFHGLISGQDPSFYLPISAGTLIDQTFAQKEQPDHFWLDVFGRLKPGISPAQANAQLLPLFRSIIREELPQFTGVNNLNEGQRKRMAAKALEVQPAAEGFNELRMQWQAPLSVLMAMVGLVLLMACVNVANLLMARAAGREREFAIRLAVGATKFQVLRQLLVESLVLSLTGGFIGLLVSGALTGGLLSLLSSDMFSGWLSGQIHWTLFWFSVTLSMITGILFGLAPALQAVRPGLAPALREKTSGISAGRSKGRFRQVLVMAQVCLSLLLLIGAGLFTRSLVNMLNVHPGFRTDHFVTFNINPQLAGYTPARSFALSRALADRLQSLPGVRSVARANVMPLGGVSIGNGLSAKGGPYDDTTITYGSEDPIGPGYFRTLGIPLVAGREFTQADNAHSPLVLILNETFARKILPHESAVGRHVRMGGNGDDTEIVGVVKDSKFAGLRQPPGNLMYVPDEQNKFLFNTASVFFLRTAGSNTGVLAAIPKIVKRFDTTLPVDDLATMEGVVDNAVHTDRLMAILAIAFGVIATTLAAVGLYGIISYSVTRRTQEFGIRLALGAERGSIVKLVIRETAWLVVIGLFIGLPVGYALARFIESQLYGVQAYDPLVLIGATVVLLSAAALAGWIPAMRALRIEPTQALRYE